MTGGQGRRVRLSALPSESDRQREFVVLWGLIVAGGTGVIFMATPRPWDFWLWLGFVLAMFVISLLTRKARMRFALRSLVVFGGAFAFFWGLSTVSAYREAPTDVQALVTVLAAALVWGIALLFLWLWRRARAGREKRRSG